MTKSKDKKSFRSMTGFGKGTASGSNLILSVDLKSINNRFLDIRIKLPKGLSAIDHLLRQRISAACQRGTVDVAFSVQKVAEAKGNTVNREVASAYIEEAKTLANELGQKTDIDLISLFRLPGVLASEEDFLLFNDDRELQELAEKAVSTALERLTEMRAQEGTQLIHVIAREAQELSQFLKNIEGLQKKSKEARTDRLRIRLEKTLEKFKIEIDESRFLQEVAFYVERSDITEEIDRLNSHINQLNLAISSKPNGAVGKKFDFLVQEMLREVNTIGSKTDAVEITDNVVQMKANLEKIREQIQNLE